MSIDPRDKDHQVLEHIDFLVPRRARYLHSAWKKHQDAVFWVDIDLVIKEGITFYQTRSNAIILQEIEDWRSFCLKDHTCLFDHHQRSHYDTITIGSEGMVSWVLQLNNSR